MRGNLCRGRVLIRGTDQLIRPSASCNWSVLKPEFAFSCFRRNYESIVCQCQLNERLRMGNLLSLSSAGMLLLVVPPASFPSMYLCAVADPCASMPGVASNCSTISKRATIACQLLLLANRKAPFRQRRAHGMLINTRQICRVKCGGGAAIIATDPRRQSSASSSRAHSPELHCTAIARTLSGE